MTPILRAVAKGLASKSAINQAGAMARQAEAEREKRAKIIHADGECQAAAKLAEAAGVINKEPVALQLRCLQTLTEIGAEKNTTVVFPVPIDTLNNWLGSS
jgi:regulator of protease activity HflC (stomatin/prohibitin superfamily)